MTAKKKGWTPHYATQSGTYRRPPMLRNSTALGGPQLGIAFVPLLVTVGRFLIPLAIGTGAYVAITKKDESGDSVTFGIKNQKIAYSAIAGGIGAAAFLGGGVLPEGMRPIATVVGAIGTAAAVAILFWPDPTKPPDTPPVKGGRVPPGQELPPNIASAVLARTLQVAMPEEQSTTQGKVRTIYTPQEYEFQVTNHSGKPLSFFSGVKITDNEENFLVYRTPDTDEPSYGRRAYTVPADGKPHIYKVKVPKLSVLRWKDIIAGRLLDVGIEIFRELSDRNPALESNAIAVRYAYSGLEAD